MTTILVTGAGGYVGSVLTSQLLCRGFNVIAFDRWTHGPTLAEWCDIEELEIVRGDCRSEADVLPHLKRADIIIPLAAIVGAPACAADQLAAYTTNFDAIRMICQHASKRQQILFPNSNSGYGTNPGICTEETHMSPISLYAKTKLRAEWAVMIRENSIAFRLATAFGMSPRMRLDLLCNDLTYRAVRDGFVKIFEPQARRNFIHVRDIAGAFIHGIETFQKMRGQIYNAGNSAENITKEQLCEKIKAQVPEFQWDYEYGSAFDPDKRDYEVSNAKLEATGWSPHWSLDEGIKELIKGYAMLRNEVYSNVH